MTFDYKNFSTLSLEEKEKAIQIPFDKWQKRWQYLSQKDKDYLIETINTLVVLYNSDTNPSHISKFEKREHSGFFVMTRKTFLEFILKDISMFSANIWLVNDKFKYKRQYTDKLVLALKEHNWVEFTVSVIIASYYDDKDQYFEHEYSPKVMVGDVDISNSEIIRHICNKVCGDYPYNFASFLRLE